MGRSFDSNDPFTQVLAPPPDETDEQRSERLREEAEATQRSQAIDEAIKAERLAAKKRKSPVKILLLGQSESGKSTTLKNFQMAYAHKAWTAERAVWRAVILLNLVRSVRVVLDTLARDMSHPHNHSQSEAEDDDDDDDEDTEAEGHLPRPLSLASMASPPITSPPPLSSTQQVPRKHSSKPLSLTEQPSLSSFTSPTSPANPSPPSTLSRRASSGPGKPRPKRRSRSRKPSLPPLTYTEHHRLIALRLTPLRHIEKDLERRLGQGSFELPPVALNSSLGAAPWPESALTPAARKPEQEFFVRSSTSWKAKVRSAVRSRDLNGDGGDSEKENGEGSRSTMANGDRKRKDDEKELANAGEVIASCAADMKVLWEDATVREMLKRRKIIMEDAPGFFLDDVERVAARGYEPTDDDVLRARLRTLGVQEYKFQLDKADPRNLLARDWVIYDVGGARTSRAAWYPYFDDMHALIFLAPISTFDEHLTEAPRINRLQDTFTLWKAICGCKLLAKSQLVLFMNKADLLEKKLLRGKKVGKWVSSYKGKEEVQEVAVYFRMKFKEIQRQVSAEPRPFYGYLTSVVDIRATAQTLAAVREGIARTYLQEADFL